MEFSISLEGGKLFLGGLGGDHITVDGSSGRIMFAVVFCAFDEFEDVLGLC